MLARSNRRRRATHARAQTQPPPPPPPPPPHTPGVASAQSNPSRHRTLLRRSRASDPAGLIPGQLANSCLWSGPSVRSAIGGKGKAGRPAGSALRGCRRASPLRVARCPYLKPALHRSRTGAAPLFCRPAAHGPPGSYVYAPALTMLLLLGLLAARPLLLLAGWVLLLPLLPPSPLLPPPPPLLLHGGRAGRGSPTSTWPKPTRSTRRCVVRGCSTRV